MTWGKRRALIIGVMVLLIIGLIWAASKPARLARGSVLVLDAEGEINEQRPVEFFDFLGEGPAPALHDYVDAIDAARTDARISGIVLRIAPLQTGWAKLEEIRAHLMAFRKSGKPSLCYLGYDGIGNPEYYLASACQQIWLVPTTPVNIRGLMAEALFLRGTLDKLKIVPEYYHIAEYKTAGNTYTEKKFTPAHREEVDSLLRSVYNQYLTDAAAARGMEREKFEALVKRGPIVATEAVQAGIVDRLGYWDQVQEYFRGRVGDWNPIPLARYRIFLNNFMGEKIAVVTATGLIVSGASSKSPGGGGTMGGDSVAADLRRARTDSGIKAIVLRIDSGGGSVVGSEVIRREVELATGAKPVVVSMSDVAASGGYWIAAPANKIVADPNTVTGSIGVVIGKWNISGLFGLLGLSTDSVATSDNASLFSAQQNFTPAQRAYIEKSIQQMYDEFKKGVAKGRNMPVEAVDKIGKGRVWSGAQAKEIGLVDELGGLDRAIEVAKRLAHIPASAQVRIVRLPEEKTFFEQLLERGRDQLSEGGAEDFPALARSAVDPGRLDARPLEATLRRIVESMEPVQALVPFELRIH
ncbi:MAG TPA: signal peptide peptidase SppA [Candidatus Sulfotelmatobacter sp.]|nr:signal peptide peptidase SppA [Candidatus Sulfotelmatobacter sp.]